MPESHKDNRRPQSFAARAAAAAVLIIILLLAVCIIELITLAVLNARLRTLETPGDTSSEESGSNQQSDPSETLPPSNTSYNAAYLPETADYGQGYIDKIIFVGDSTTYGMKYYAVLAGGNETKQVWTPASGTLSLNINIAQTPIRYPRTDTDMSIADAAALEKPEYMVITIGINYGVPFLDEVQFKQCYRKLLDALTTASPGTKYILQSIYPVAKNNNKETITNARIDRANLWVADLALEYGMRYLDTNPALKDSDGYLVYAYQNGDGLHLNKGGFDAVLAYIRTHGYPNS